MHTRALVAVAALALAGCHAVRYDAGRAPSQRRWEKTIHFWAWGFQGDGRVDLDAACPEGAASWQNQQTFGDLLLDLFTLGIYVPRTITVTCAEVRR